MLFIDSVLFWFIGDIVIKRWFLKIDLATREAKNMMVNNIYMQISTTLQRSSMYFFVQFALMIFYIYSLNNTEIYQNEHDVSYVKWLVAMVLTAIAGEDEVGTAFDFKFWETLDKDRLGSSSTRFCCIDVPLRRQWQVRKFYSFCVNLIFRQVILG